MKYFIIISTFVAVSVIAFGCSSESKRDAEVKEPEAEAIESRIRPAAKGGTTAAYFVYENNLAVADTLFSVESAIAEMTQIHQTYETEDGMMGMREQTDIVVRPGEQIIFEQGGLHVMLMQLKQNVTEGDTVLVKLHFNKRGEIEFQLPVKAQ